MTRNSTPTDGEVSAAIGSLRDVRHLGADDVGVALKVAQLLRAEREACAKVAESAAVENPEWTGSDIATAIRNRNR